MESIFDAPLYDNDLLKLCVRFAHDLLFMALVVRYGLKRNGTNPEFAFAAVMLNITIFFICFTLKKLELGMGMAIGLFAVFGVLRYRTEPISTKEMTYLFILIGIAIMNSLANKKTSYAELLSVNLVLFGAAVLKERMIRLSPKPTESAGPKKPPKYTVVYDKIDMLAPSRREALLEDLHQRTGLDIERLQVGEIDLTTSTARLTIWYEDPQQSQT